MSQTLQDVLRTAFESHGYTPALTDKHDAWSGLLTLSWEDCLDLTVKDLGSLGFDDASARVWMVLRKVRQLLSPSEKRETAVPLQVEFASGQRFTLRFKDNDNNEVTPERVRQALCTDAASTVDGDPSLVQFSRLVNWVAHVHGWQSQLSDIRLVAAPHQLNSASVVILKLDGDFIKYTGFTPPVSPAVSGPPAKDSIEDAIGVLLTAVIAQRGAVDERSLRDSVRVAIDKAPGLPTDASLSVSVGGGAAEGVMPYPASTLESTEGALDWRADPSVVARIVRLEGGATSSSSSLSESTACVVTVSPRPSGVLPMRISDRVCV